jgi:hypothetical protein
MKKLQWNMEEVFYFPENIGVPKEARLVKVKAGFTEKRSEDAVRLSGIYHITAKLDFTEGQRSEGFPPEAVFVDDVELEGETGYFEYAVPLYIDLPPEVDNPLHIEATDIKSTFDGQGGFTVAWNVNCRYGQASANETASDASASDASASDATASREGASKERAQTEENKNSSSTSTEDTTAVQEVRVEKVVAEKEEKKEVVQAAESKQSSASQNRTAAAPVQDTSLTTMHDSTLNGQEDILSYIAALPDEWTTSRFRSNDIFVKEES